MGFGRALLVGRILQLYVCSYLYQCIRADIAPDPIQALIFLDIRRLGHRFSMAKSPHRAGSKVDRQTGGSSPGVDRLSQ